MTELLGGGSGPFLVMTLVLFGGAAFLTGQALAQSGVGPGDRSDDRDRYILRSDATGAERKRCRQHKGMDNSAHETAPSPLYVVSSSVALPGAARECAIALPPIAADYFRRHPKGPRRA